MRRNYSTGVVCVQHKTEFCPDAKQKAVMISAFVVGVLFLPVATTMTVIASFSSLDNICCSILLSVLIVPGSVWATVNAVRIFNAALKLSFKRWIVETYHY